MFRIQFTVKSDSFDRGPNSDESEIKIIFARSGPRGFSHLIFGAPRLPVSNHPRSSYVVFADSCAQCEQYLVCARVAKPVSY